MGSVLIIITLSITLILWFLGKPEADIIFLNPIISLNQLTALWGTVFLSWTMFLSTRFSFLEDWFGGLDKVYKAHKKTAILGTIFIILHPLFLAFNAFSNKLFGLAYFLPVHKNIILNFGVYSLWTFIFLIFMTLFIRFRYDIWKNLHKLFGIAFLIGFIHILGIGSDIASFPILGIWMFFIVGIGLASYIYIEFLYKHLAPSFLYQLVRIKKKEDIYLLDFKPVKEKINYYPGQFIYLSFVNSRVIDEFHPFSITSHPSEDVLSFAIKKLGDYTSTLDELKSGDVVRIYGPYGRFGERLKEDKDVILIGAGVGIAPFISITKELIKRNNNKKVSLFYCTKDKKEAFCDYDLKQLLSTSPNNFYLNQCSRQEGRLSIEKVINQIKNPENTLIFLCGPNKMISELSSNLINRGISKKNIVSGMFNFI